MEAWQAPEHKNYNKENVDHREGYEYECPLCMDDEKGDVIAFVPCGHRVCPGCWADMRARDIYNCPQCRALIAHGGRQESLPDELCLFSRFCVEVPST
jgi:hypothetical protein